MMQEVEEELNQRANTKGKKFLYTKLLDKIE